jgi:hypothetical protein
VKFLYAQDMAMEPRASRPHIPGYGIPDSEKGMLPWSHAVERLKDARNYWIGTAGSDGRPRVRAAWGVWVDEGLAFGGSPEVGWQRNLYSNPYAEVHLESAEDVVIVEGVASSVGDEDSPELVRRIKGEYERKYNFDHPAPFWLLRPKRAFAWTDFPKTTTRWLFD